MFKLIREFSKFSGYKTAFNIQGAYLDSKNEIFEKEIK